MVSEHASVIIEDLSLEVPPNRERGYLNTVEGILQRIVEDLSQGQAERQVIFDHFSKRKLSDLESCEKIHRVIETIQSIIAGHKKCTLTIDDPSGNSYIENLYAFFCITYKVELHQSQTRN